MAEAEVGVVVAAGDFGNRLKLTFICRKEGFLCQEAMGQVLRAKGPVQDVVWAKDKVEAGWVDRLPQGRAEIAYAQTAVQQFLMLRDSLAIKEAVQSVVRK